MAKQQEKSNKQSKQKSAFGLKVTINVCWIALPLISWKLLSVLELEWLDLSRCQHAVRNSLYCVLQTLTENLGNSLRFVHIKD